MSVLLSQLGNYITGYRIQDTGFRIQDTGYRIHCQVMYFYLILRINADLSLNERVKKKKRKRDIRRKSEKKVEIWNRLKKCTQKQHQIVDLIWFKISRNIKLKISNGDGLQNFTLSFVPNLTQVHVQSIQCFSIFSIKLV